VSDCCGVQTDWTSHYKCGTLEDSQLVDACWTSTSMEATSVNTMLFVDKHCSDVFSDAFVVLQIDHNSKYVKKVTWNIFLQLVWTNTPYFEHWKYPNLFAFSSISAEYLQKLTFLFPKGSVVTCLRWGGYYRMCFVANFIRFPAMQKFWKSVKIWQSYREFKGGNFFWDTV